MNMTINELVDNFDLFEDWEERYHYLIDLGRRFPVMNEAFKTPANKVSGCISDVWLNLYWEKGRLTIEADSNAEIVKGLIAVLLVIFNGKSAEEIAAIDIDLIFKKLGFDEHLFPNRRNGFYSMVERIRLFINQG